MRPARRLGGLRPGRTLTWGRIRARSRGLGAALAVALLCAGGAARAETPGLRDLQMAAFAAVEAGDDAAARQLALAILEKHPRDGLAEFVLTVVTLRNGQLDAARGHGRRAFRFAEPGQQKFQAAMIAADIADREGRRVALRYWLREAADEAPNDRLRSAALAVLNQEKARSPLSFGVGVGLTPSSNVNNGSSSPYSVIDGLPIVGVISEEGQALAGWEGSLRLSFGLRLAETARSRTQLISTLTLYRVALSGAAEREAPDFDAADMADNVLTFGLKHSFLLPGDRSKLDLTVEAGRGWAGSGTGRDLAEIGLRWSRDLGGGQSLILGAEMQWTRPDIATRADYRRGSLTFGYATTLKSGDTLYGEVALSDTHAGPGSDRTSREGQTAMLRVVWAKKEPIGAFSLSASAGVQFADYPDYRLGFITVPGGRQDTTGFAEVSLGLDSWSVAGFRPVLSLRTLQTRSNVSIFETRDTGLGLSLSRDF